MQTISLWLTVIIGIILPFIGWAFNSIITKKIDDLDATQKERTAIFFKKLDENRKLVEDNYVRKDMYEQAHNFLQQASDEKFKSMLSIINTRFESIEDKIEEVRKLLANGNGNNKK